MSDTKYLVLSVDDFLRITKLGEDSINAIFGKMGVRKAKEEIDGDEITKAFIRGFNFHAAGEPQPEGAKLLTAKECYEITCDAYNGAYGMTRFSPWDNCSDVTRRMYQCIADRFNLVMK